MFLSKLSFSFIPDTFEKFRNRLVRKMDECKKKWKKKKKHCKVRSIMTVLARISIDLMAVYFDENAACEI